jgi:hypothetical protein
LDGLREIRDAEHGGVSDRLHMRPAPRGELFVYSFEELGNQVCGLFVAMSLGQRGVAGDIGEQERRGRRFRRRADGLCSSSGKVRTIISPAGGQVADAAGSAGADKDGGVRWSVSLFG